MVAPVGFAYRGYGEFYFHFQSLHISQQINTAPIWKNDRSNAVA